MWSKHSPPLPCGTCVNYSEQEAGGLYTGTQVTGNTILADYWSQREKYVHCLRARVAENGESARSAINAIFCNIGSLCLSLALFGSLWLAVWLTLGLSGSLRLSLALYCSPNLLTKSLLGSRGSRGSNRSSATALLDILQVC